jgi:small-conductance mechanosensitive channel
MKDRATFEPGNFVKDFGKVLEDYWERFLFLLPNLVFAAVILGITFFVAGKIKAILRNRLGGKAHDKITAEYIAIISKWVVFIIGLLLAFQALGLSGIAGGLLASAGVSAVVVGFAFKDIAQNFLAGLILAFNRPFNVNDTVQIQDTLGRVVSLDLRTTHLLTFDSKDVYIPNGIILTTPVTNFTRNGLIRMDFIVGIDFNDDIEKAIRLIENTVSRIEGVQRENPPYAAVAELATNTVNLKVFFFTETDDYKKGAVLLKGKVMQEVKKALLDNGFGLPANVLELKMYDRQQRLPVELTGKLSPNGKEKNG